MGTGEHLFYNTIIQCYAYPLN